MSRFDLALETDVGYRIYKPIMQLGHSELLEPPFSLKEGVVDLLLSCELP
jgi:hypothetical protein